MDKKHINKLSKALRHFNTGKLTTSEQLCNQIRKRYPDQPDVLNILGVIAIRKSQYLRAINLIAKAISSQPKEPLYHYNLGLAYCKTLRFKEAVTSFYTVTQLKPDFTAVYSDLCHALTELGDADSALQAGLSAIKHYPNDANAHNNIAVSYEATGDFDSAISHYMKAVELAPLNPVFHNNLGNLYLGNGMKESAEEHYRKAIKLEPTFGEPHLQLAYARKHTSTDNADAKVIREKLVNNTINDIDRCDLHFAYGKILDDCEYYDEAFKHFSKANNLANRRYSFQPDHFRQYINNIIETFSCELIKQHEYLSISTNEPVFIVGMPRSGSSLVEQIIASHPQVYGGGELLWFGKLEQRLAELLGSASAYPQCLELLDSDTSQMLSKEYCQYTEKLSNGHERVTDKMPENFLRIGLIKLLFKNAKFIYCRRNPMDVGLSIYQQRFAGSIHWGYDLFNIGAYYAQHGRIMRHWLNIFNDSIHIVDYEELVQSQETVSQDIIKFLDLPWNAACLEYYKTKRHIHTASDVQVKKPIYNSSVARWRNYENQLEPLKKGLNAFSDNITS